MRQEVTRERGGRFCRIEIEIKDTPTGKELSVCGSEGRITRYPGRENIGKGPGGYHEMESGGQIVESLREWFPECAPLLPWHLNGMRAGCEHQRAEGWDKRPIDPAKPLNAYGKHCGPKGPTTWNMLAWVTKRDHPEGLLSEPCPTCGYKYGSAWLHEELPANVLALASTFASTVQP